MSCFSVGEKRERVVNTPWKKGLIPLTDGRMVDVLLFCGYSLPYMDVVPIKNIVIH
jgi:hypothetical protein